MILKFFEALTNLIRVLYKKTAEQPSPQDFIKRHQIFWNEDEGSVTIHGIKGRVRIPEIADTNSMDGLMDYGHNVLLVEEFDRNKLIVGDIVVFRPTMYRTNSIIHRISKIGEDEDGRWYFTRGDNNAIRDPYRLRNQHIGWLCIGIIY